jgi:hypothetical protein
VGVGLADGDEAGLGVGVGVAEGVDVALVVEPPPQAATSNAVANELTINTFFVDFI